MDQNLLQYMITFAGFISSVAVVKHQIKDLKEEKLKLQGKLDLLAEKYHALPETYVNFTHFRETILLIRQDNKEVKEDVKKILEIMRKN